MRAPCDSDTDNKISPIRKNKELLLRDFPFDVLFTKRSLPVMASQCLSIFPKYLRLN